MQPFLPVFLSARSFPRSHRSIFAWIVVGSFSQVMVRIGWAQRLRERLYVGTFYYLMKW